MSTSIRKAEIRDLVRIMEISNRAYDIESGSTGIAFKSTRRYLNLEEIRKDLRYFYVLLLNDTKIIGAVKTKVDIDSNVVEIGSLAVDPHYQVLFDSLVLSLF